MDQKRKRSSCLLSSLHGTLYPHALGPSWGHPTSNASCLFSPPGRRPLSGSTNQEEAGVFPAYLPQGPGAHGTPRACEGHGVWDHSLPQALTYTAVIELSKVFKIKTFSYPGAFSQMATRHYIRQA